MIVGLFKLLTLPIWGPFWVIGAVFRARSVTRTGRKVYPVRALPAPSPRSVTYVLTTRIPDRPDLP